MNPSTYAEQPSRRPVIPLWIAVVQACWPLGFYVWVWITRCVARVVLGFWPRGPMDDPKGIDYVGTLRAIGILLYIYIPVSLLGLLLASWCQARERLRILALGLAAWALGAALLWWDPGWAFDWFMD
jgi:hypothetical protein